MHLIGSIYSSLQLTHCTVSKSAALHHDTPLDLSFKDFRLHSLNLPLYFPRVCERESERETESEWEREKKKVCQKLSTTCFSKMPRSFLVKKHTNSAKKPNYSELESPTGKVWPKLSQKFFFCATFCLHVFLLIQATCDPSFPLFFLHFSFISSVLHAAHLQGPSSARHPAAGDPEPGGVQPHHSMDYQQLAAVSAPQRPLPHLWIPLIALRHLL